jgi:ferredoxin
LPDRFHKNAPGAFYVEAECCLTCGIPQQIAPEIFAWHNEGDSGHCYVQRQPQTSEEFDKVIEVMQHADLDCIYYGGSDRAELDRLSLADLAAQCDALQKP